MHCPCMQHAGAALPMSGADAEVRNKDWAEGRGSQAPVAITRPVTTSTPAPEVSNTIKQAESREPIQHRIPTSRCRR